MSRDLRLRGVYIPLITPFAADGSVALDAVERLANEYLEAGAAGIVARGTTGETPALDADERQQVIDVCARVCDERGAQLLIGIGTNNTAGTAAAAAALAGTPALVAALVVVPYYVRPSEDGIVAHYRAVAEVSPVPIVLYNVPSRTGRALSAGRVLELAAEAKFAGIKQAMSSIDVDTLQLLAGIPEGFAVLGGTDDFLFPLVLMGSSGTICATAHVCTERFVAMIECGLAGKVDEGRAHAEALLPVTQGCFAEPNPMLFKGVLHAQGRIPTPDVRLPLVNASAGAIERALTAIDKASH
ncbi:MAG: 4-hydroxy-tetrahydrodipicolinate synthase [Acidimicrobiia bacterium]